MSKEEQPKYDELFEGIRETLENEGRLLSNLTHHPGEKGRLNETHLKSVLRRYLPTKFGIGTGFIVSKNSFKETIGPQVDIVIYDAVNNSPIYTSEAFSIFPIEMVYGYIEVKTDLKREDLKDALAKNRILRGLADDKVYLYGQPRKVLAPRFYIFAYKSVKRLEKMIREEFDRQRESHAHGIYSLQLDQLVLRQARDSADIVDLLVWDEHAFPIFIANIVRHCDQMIPVKSKRDRTPTNLTLPLADMITYLSKPRKA